MKELKLNPDELEQFRAGGGVYDQIYNHYFPECVSFALTIIDIQDVAEDISTEKLKKLRDLRDGSFTSAGIRKFLKVAVRNACIDYIKARKTEARNLQAYARHMPTADHPEKETDTDEVKRKAIEIILKKIPNLPGQQRLVMELMVQGLKRSEIAYILRLSVKTVSNLKSEAIKTLKNMKLLD